MRNLMRLLVVWGDRLLLAFVLRCRRPAAQAAINAQNLGAKYDGTQSNITFQVYSSRATRIEVGHLQDRRPARRKSCAT